ncbi:hypothetical protein K3Z85_21570, partial [Pseudomonas aeruginosa]|nr:hypothetical protein [Pseudomonas aeruginosa]
MQRVLSIALAFCLALTVSLDANAKRFGGGKSLGSAPSHQTRQAQPATAPNATAAALVERHFLQQRMADTHGD